MTLRIVVSRRAETDLGHVYQTSENRWGRPQADRYLRLIWAAINLIADHPSSGATCDDVRPGYRKSLTGGQWIFYRLAGDTIVIIRVLHTRMDALRHLHSRPRGV